MALITLRQLLDDAAESEYECGAPDVDGDDLEQVRAIVEEVAVFDAALRAVQAVRAAYPPRMPLPVGSLHTPAPHED